MEMYFNHPKQIVFADPDNVENWIVGIAYKDEIICACCGNVFNINEVVEQAEAEGIKQAIYPYEDWNDIAYEIVGGEWPTGLVEEDGKLVEFDIDEYEGHYFKKLKDTK